MAIDKTYDKSLVQNLKDAGCDSEIIAHFLQLYQNGEIGDQLCILAEHRQKLLGEIHKGQAKLDCLDFLICQIKKTSR